MRKISNNMHFSIIGFHYFLGGLIISSIWSFAQQRETFPLYSPVMFAFLVGQALVLFLMQVSMTVAYKYVTAAVSSVIIYVNIPMGYLLDYLFFGKVIGKLETVGACLIVGVNVTLGFLKGRGYIS